MCVYRSGQRLTASQVAEAVSGREPEKWMATIRQCISLGVLAVDHEGDGALSRTPLGAAVMRGETRVVLRRWQPTRAPKKPKRKPRVSGDASAVRSALARLTAWRADEAVRRAVPPHAVFHDTALAEIARRLPQTRFGLRWIPGVGPRKAALYGETIVRLVQGAGR
jgi:ATP-dependent DNA helicase RecQ